MLHYVLHNLLMLYLAVRQSYRFFLYDVFYLLFLAIVGSISDSFIATAASSASGIKEHYGVSIRNRRLHSKNARKRQCDEQYKMYYQ